MRLTDTHDYIKQIKKQRLTMYHGELWASQVALLVKNLPAKEMPEMWVQSLGWEDLLDEILSVCSSRFLRMVQATKLHQNSSKMKMTQPLVCCDSDSHLEFRKIIITHIVAQLSPFSNKENTHN